MYSFIIFHIMKNTQNNWWKSPYYRLGVFIKILPFSRHAQNTKQFISVDSLSWTGHNSTNNFLIACTVVKIIWSTSTSRDQVLESTSSSWKQVLRALLNTNTEVHAWSISDNYVASLIPVVHVSMDLNIAALSQI